MNDVKKAIGREIVDVGIIDNSVVITFKDYSTLTINCPNANNIFEKDALDILNGCKLKDVETIREYAIATYAIHCFFKISCDNALRQLRIEAHISPSDFKNTTDQFHLEFNPCPT